MNHDDLVLVVMILASGIGSISLYLLRDIRDTLKNQSEHVLHIDTRVSRLEGRLD
ncbi:MAG: hypothetical protein R8K20_11705 [Gallionellaceae bacterium]